METFADKSVRQSYSAPLPTIRAIFDGRSKAKKLSDCSGYLGAVNDKAASAINCKRAADAVQG
jgi:hypothetical protein